MKYKATERAWVKRLLARLSPEQRERYEARVKTDAIRHHHSGKIYDREKARIAEQILLEDMPKRKRDFLGYCGKCGRNVVADYCEHCQRYVQPSPHQRSADA